MRQGTLPTTLLRIMADGKFWHVEEALAEVVKLGHATTKASVKSTLSRCSADGGLFEHGQRGMYRVRPEIVAGWAEKAA